MNDRIRRHHERNGRVKQFHADNAADFPTPSIGHDHFTTVGTAYDDATALQAAYVAAYGQSGLDTVVRSVAREELRSAMSQIARTARSMNYDFPGITDQFHMPRGASDADLLAAGRAFYTASAAFDFASYGMPATFRTDLNTKCDAFQTSLASTGTAMDNRVAALAEISDKVMSPARNVRILDGVVRNKYHGIPGQTAAWESASHVEAAPKKENGTPTPVPIGGGGPHSEPPTP